MNVTNCLKKAKSWGGRGGEDPSLWFIWSFVSTPTAGCQIIEAFANKFLP